MAWPLPQLKRPDWPEPPSPARWLALLLAAFAIGLTTTSLLWPRASLGQGWRFWGWALLMPWLVWLMLWGLRYYLFETERENIRAEHQAQDELRAGWVQWARAALPVTAVSVIHPQERPLNGALSGQNGPHQDQALALDALLPGKPLPQRLLALLDQLLTPELRQALARLDHCQLLLCAPARHAESWRSLCWSRLSELPAGQAWQAGSLDLDPEQTRAWLLAAHGGPDGEGRLRQPALLLAAHLHPELTLGASAPAQCELGFALLLQPDAAQPLVYLPRPMPTDAAQMMADFATLQEIQLPGADAPRGWHSQLDKTAQAAWGRIAELPALQWLKNQPPRCHALDSWLGQTGAWGYPLQLALLCQLRLPGAQVLAWQQQESSWIQAIINSPPSGAMEKAA